VARDAEPPQLGPGNDSMVLFRNLLNPSVNCFHCLKTAKHGDLTTDCHKIGRRQPIL
jgi:hypothetical protein